MDVIDLHCDLLGYLAAKPSRTPYDLQTRCSIPQLEKGNVRTQVVAIGAETHYLSLLFGLRQFELFLQLPECKTQFIPAFENASAFSLENEPLDDSLNRLEMMLQQIHPLYISLTWNGENRFGGGCGCDVGLKSDGKTLLEFLSGRSIAVDFSHTSDKLADDLFDFIDLKGLDIPVMASHSNFRSVIDHPRNLTDRIAKEIIRREGLIGLVFYRKFLGQPEDIYRHIDYGLTLGGEKSLAIGADFFFTEDLIKVIADKVGFHQEMNDSSCYPYVIELLTKMGLKIKIIEQILFKNAQNKVKNVFNIEQQQ